MSIIIPTRPAILDKTNPLARGLGGYWPMVAGTGGKIFDISGNGQQGTINGAVWESGKNSSCLGFDGDAYVTIADKVYPGYFSVVAWINSTSGNIQTILDWKDDSGQNDGLWFAVDLDYYGSHRIYCYMDIGTAYGSGAGVFNDGQWHQVAVTFDGSTISYYLDAQLSDTDNASGVNTYTGSGSRIGSAYTGEYKFSGQIANLMMYDRALTLSHIASLYREPNQLIWQPRSPGWISYVASGGETYVRTINDGLGITDAQVRTQALLRNISDGVGVADDSDRTQVLTRSFDEALGIADAIVKAQGYARDIADDIGALDALTKSQAFARTIADDVGLADLVTRLVTYARTLAEALGLSDAATSVKDSPRTISDGIGITDSVARSMAQARTVADAMGVTDDVTRVQVQLRTIADALGLTDQMTPGQILLISDAMGITDSMTREQVIIRTVADALGITDDLTRIAAYVFTQAEDIGIADSMLRVATAIRTISDDVGITDSRDVVHNVGGLIKAAWAFMIMRQTQN